MNSNKLKSVRIEQGKSAMYMSKVINKAYNTYVKKENGEIKFSPDEIAHIADELSLSPEMVKEIFLTLNLPNGNYQS